MKQFISSSSSLLKQIWNDREIRIVQKNYYLKGRKFNLIDISMNGSGHEEDAQYIRSAFYRKNIRRGNTIIEDPKGKYSQFGRKGIPKMLDIKLQHIHYFLKKKHLSRPERNIAEIIFEQVNYAFEDGKRVQLIKTQKLNGQNAQVSYNYEYDAWIICSKNVSILATCIQDLNIYKQKRYDYAQLIAKQWFHEIKNLAKDQLASLKKTLDGYTAVGQYSGNPEYQHLVSYQQIGIRWFGIVDNFSEEYCMDPFQSKNKLQKFGFKFAKMRSVILTSSPDNFFETLQKLYLKTVQAGIEDQEYGMQGSIVYFVISQKDKGKEIGRQVAVGGGKLKTLQYRYLRKIRQKVSRYVQRSEKMQEVLKKFKEEINELEIANMSHPPFPQHYYCNILSACIQFMDVTKISLEIFKKNFISILKIIFYSLHKRLNIKTYGQAMFKDQQFISKVSKIEFSKYSGLGSNTKIVYIVLGLPGMYKSYLGEQISSHFEKILVPYSILPIDNVQNLDEDLKLLYQAESSGLQHYYLDGSFDSHSISIILKNIKKNRDLNSYYKIILIADEQKNIFGTSKNCYPFTLQTIVMSYYGKHQQKINCPRIQEKIVNLKEVTEKLSKNVNFHESMNRMNLQIYHYPFSRHCKLEKQKQFQALIEKMLEKQDQKSEFNTYGLFILRLQQIQEVKYMSQNEIKTQIEHLIKASYPSIPLISFKK